MPPIKVKMSIVVEHREVVYKEKEGKIKGSE